MRFSRAFFFTISLISIWPNAATAAKIPEDLVLKVGGCKLGNETTTDNEEGRRRLRRNGSLAHALQEAGWCIDDVMSKSVVVA